MTGLGHLAAKHDAIPLAADGPEAALIESLGSDGQARVAVLNRGRGRRSAFRRWAASVGVHVSSAEAVRRGRFAPALAHIYTVELDNHWRR